MIVGQAEKDLNTVYGSLDKLFEENETLKKQLVDLNHAIDIYWNDGRTINAEKYICYQQKKTFELVACKECKKYPCACHDPF